VGVTIGVILLVVLVVGLGGFAAYSLLNGHIPGLSGNGANVATLAATPATAGAAVGVPTPEAAVDAWFVAVSQGDLAAVKKTATPDFASNIDASMFEGRDPHTSYRIDNTDIQGDRATVDVQESPTDAPAQTATTFTLLKQPDGTWLVSQYVVAATGETPGASDAGTGVEPATQKPAFDKTDAIDVVGTMLSGLKGTGSLSAAKAAATSRFKSANPGWIMRSSDYDFYVTGAKKQGDVWIVTAKEQWQSGAETANYTVVVKDGKGYVDRRNGLN
jgi:ketosteroid isomerase-like protein